MAWIAIKAEGKTFFKIESAGGLYGYVSKISSRNWANKSLILVARAVIKATAIAIFTKSIEEAEIKNLLTVDSASALIFNLW